MRTTKTKTSLAGNAICAYCKGQVPDFETARCMNTPPGHQPLPAGSAWVICGDDCPEKPAGAEVFFRLPLDRRNGKGR